MSLTFVVMFFVFALMWAVALMSRLIDFAAERITGATLSWAVFGRPMWLSREEFFLKYSEKIEAEREERRE